MPVLIDNKVVNLNSGLQTLRFRNETLQYDGKIITLDELKAKSRQNPAEEIRVKVVGGQVAAPTAGPAAPPPPPQHTDTSRSTLTHQICPHFVLSLRNPGLQPCPRTSAP